MAIEIVDVSIKNGDFPLQNVSSPEGMCSITYIYIQLYTYTYIYIYIHMYTYI